MKVPLSPSHRDTQTWTDGQMTQAEVYKWQALRCSSLSLLKPRDEVGSGVGRARVSGLEVWAVVATLWERGCPQHSCSH